MNKRLKFIIASALSTGIFLLIFLFPFYIYPKQFVYSLLTVLFMYMALGLRGSKLGSTTLGYMLLPGLFTFGFYQIALLFDKNLFWSVAFGLINFFVLYVFMLVYNIFYVTELQKTPALYRSARTVSMLFSLFVSYLLFNFMWSLRLPYYLNFVTFFITSIPIFLHVVWVLVVGDEVQKGKGGIVGYVLVPSLILAQMSVIFSFWPSSIFLSSLYIVIVFYLTSQLVSIGALEKNVEGAYKQLFWVGLLAVLSIILSTQWR